MDLRGDVLRVAVVATQRGSERDVVPSTLLRRWNTPLPWADGEDLASRCSKRHYLSLREGKAKQVHVLLVTSAKSIDYFALFKRKHSHYIQNVVFYGLISG